MAALSQDIIQVAIAANQCSHGFVHCFSRHNSYALGFVGSTYLSAFLLESSASHWCLCFSGLGVSTFYVVVGGSTKFYFQEKTLGKFNALIVYTCLRTKLITKIVLAIY